METTKVLGIYCSPRLNGNSAILLGETLTSASAAGAQVKTFRLHSKHISPCESCYTCRKTGKCKIEDDNMTALYDLILEADAIVFATPAYYLGPPGPAKTVLYRLFALGCRINFRARSGPH